MLLTESCYVSCQYPYILIQTILRTLLGSGHSQFVLVWSSLWPFFIVDIFLTWLTIQINAVICTFDITREFWFLEPLEENVNSSMFKTMFLKVCLCHSIKACLGAIRVWVIPLLVHCKKFCCPSYLVLHSVSITTACIQFNLLSPMLFWRWWFAWRMVDFEW